MDTNDIAQRNGEIGGWNGSENYVVLQEGTQCTLYATINDETGDVFYIVEEDGSQEPFCSRLLSPTGLYFAALNRFIRIEFKQKNAEKFKFTPAELALINGLEG